MKFSAAIVLASALFALTASRPAPNNNVAPGDAPYTLCSGWDSQITINSLKFDPNPPSIKKPFVVIANGNLKSTVTQGAKMIVTATLGSMPVATQEIDMCEEAAKSGLNCPIAPGTHDLRNLVPLPKGVQIPPFVGIKVHAEAFNGDGSKLFCLDTTVKFSP